MRRLVESLAFLVVVVAACETQFPTSSEVQVRLAVYPGADVVQKGIEYSAISPPDVAGAQCQWMVDGDAMVTFWSRPDCEREQSVTMWIEYTARLTPGVWRIGLNVINTGAGLGDDPTWYPEFRVASSLNAEVIRIPASDTEVNYGYTEYTVPSEGYYTVRYWWLNDRYDPPRDANIKIMSAFFDKAQGGGGAAGASTLTMYYWDNGWVRLGAIDGGFLPADLRIGINAHNWGPDWPGFWAEFDNITAYGDIDLPQGVIEDFDGAIGPIWDVQSDPGWWYFDPVDGVARADVPPGSDNGIYHIASMGTWQTVVHGEFDVQVDFTLDPAFHSLSSANVMLCLWDEPYMNGICAAHSSGQASGFYGLWRGTDATGPQPAGFYTLMKYQTHGAGKLRVTRTPVHRGSVVESVSGSGSFTTADGDWRTLSFSARRHADGTVDGQWERIRRNEGNAADWKSSGVVTCFTVLDGEAWIGGVATNGLYSTPPANRVVWRVVDRGNGQAGVPDQISDQGTGGEGILPAWYCAARYPGPDLHDIEAGNITIGR
jgi:hypothetical protein